MLNFRIISQKSQRNHSSSIPRIRNVPIQLSSISAIGAVRGSQTTMNDASNFDRPSANEPLPSTSDANSVEQWMRDQPISIRQFEKHERLRLKMAGS